MGLRSNVDLIHLKNSEHDENVHGVRAFWTRQPLLNRGATTDGTVAPGSAGLLGTVNIAVPADEVWFLKKVVFTPSGFDDGTNTGTSYAKQFFVDGVNFGTLGTQIICDTLYGDTIVCRGSITFVGSFNKVGTLGGTFSAHVEGLFTKLTGYDSPTAETLG